MAYVSKVIYGGETLIDLTSDTVTPATLLAKETAHDKAGNPITGTCTFDADTKDGTASADEILYNQVAYVNEKRIVGTMPYMPIGDDSYTGNNMTNDGFALTHFEQQVPIQKGYSDGTQSVFLLPVERAKFISSNIKSGVTLLGVTGSMTGDELFSKPQNKEVTPSKSEQTIVPDAGYTHMMQVTVHAIPISRTQNSAGGITVTIL